MNHSPIIHEWFFPEGPTTFEYPLPVEEFLVDHESVLPEWLRNFASKNVAEAKQSFSDYVQSISFPGIQPILDVVGYLEPYSVVVQESRSWLLCKNPNRFKEPSGPRNMLQLPPPNENVDWPSFFKAEKFDPLKHLIKYFGGTRLDMPPTCGFDYPDQLIPAVEDPDDGIWMNIDTWTGSVPVFSFGGGDAVLVRPDAQFGIWDHECGSKENCAVRHIGSFDEFVKLVSKQFEPARSGVLSSNYWG